MPCFLQIFLQDPLLKPVPGSRIDGMRDVTVLSVRSPAAGHRDKQPLIPIDYFDVVDYKFVVNGNRYDSFHLTFLLHPAYSYICYLHSCIPFLILPRDIFVSCRPSSPGNRTCVRMLYCRKYAAGGGPAGLSYITYLSLCSYTTLMPSPPLK